MLGMSQEKLGDALGLAFSKSRNMNGGANRVGASRLYDLSRVLDVPVSYFFKNWKHRRRSWPRAKDRAIPITVPDRRSTPTPQIKPPLFELDQGACLGLSGSG